MDLMEAIGAFADKIEQGDCEDTLELDEIDYPSRQGSLPRYHNETFTYAIGK